MRSFFRNDSDLCFEFDLYAFDADPAQQVESLFGAVIVAVNHPSDTGLNNQNKTIKMTTYRALCDKRIGDNDELCR